MIKKEKQNIFDSGVGCVQYLILFVVDIILFVFVGEKNIFSEKR